MSLIRRMWLLMLCTVLLTFMGGVALHAASTALLLEGELRRSNSAAAVRLANDLPQVSGGPASWHAAISERFAAGDFRRIRFIALNGQDDVLRERVASPKTVPSWFLAVLPLDSPSSRAMVFDRGHLLGSVEVVGETDRAVDALWGSCLRFAAQFVLLSIIAVASVIWVVRRMRMAIAATLAQADSLERGDYLTAPVPTVPELRQLTNAMNSMVARLRGVFEAQAIQVESLRRQASCDPLTGLSNRGHFLAQLGAALIREDASAAGGMVLLRVLRLSEMNRSVGREEVDHLILAVGRTLQAYISHVRGAFVGRLNGSDFALVLPESGMSMETSEAVVNLLRIEMPIFSPQGAVVAGAVEIIPGCAVADLLADADMALARAENAGPFAVMSAGEQGGEAWWRIGERGWRERVHQALDQGQVQLGSFPLVDAQGRLIHLECPLRMQLEPDGAYEPAGHWLPLATRSRLTSAVDERALSLALEAIARDGQPRSINISPASLPDSGFSARLRKRLQETPRAARHVWIEITEAAADEQFELMRELARQLRPTGARFGIEHAGERLGSIQRLFEAGLDYVKLDAAFTRGVATNADRANFVQGLVGMLHGLSLQVFGEGIVDEVDATKLWECGVDGLTGPWFSDPGA